MGYPEYAELCQLPVDRTLLEGKPLGDEMPDIALSAEVKDRLFIC